MKNTFTKLIGAAFLTAAVSGVQLLNAQAVTYNWVSHSGGTTYDYATSAFPDPSGSLYVTGMFRGTSDFDPGTGTSNLTSAGAEDIFVAKYDATGAYQWAVRIGGANSDIGKCVYHYSGGAVFVCGTFEGTVDFDPGSGTSNLTSQTAASAFILKLDPSGNFVWAKTIGSNMGTNLESFYVDFSGQVLLTGDYTGTVDLDPGAATVAAITTGQTDVFMVQLDASGNYVWGKTFGGSSFDHCADVAVNGSGEIILTGYFAGTCDFEPGSGSTTVTASSTDFYVAVYTSAGTLTWVKGIGGSGAESGNSIVVTGTDIAVTGSFEGTVDFDPGSGSTVLTAGTGISDAFVMTLTSNGNFGWAAELGGTSVDAGQSIARDIAGNLFITGRFSGTADFDPGAGTANLVSAGNYDIFMLKLSAAGAHVWSGRVGGTSGDVGNCIVVDGNDNVYLAGYFAGTADFDPQGGTANLTTAGQDDIFFGKYTQSGVGIAETSALNLNVYPNPCAEIIQVTMNANGATVFNIYNAAGQLVLTNYASASTASINVSQLESGLYILESVQDGNISRSQFVKQ